MVANRDGAVFLVYSAYNGAQNVVVATRYYPGVGWGGAVVISNTSLYAYGEAQVAVDPFGNAFALWNTYNATFSGAFLQYSFYTPLTGWSAPRDYTLNTTAYPGQLKAAMDGLGNGYTFHRWHNGSSYEDYVGQVNIDGTQSAIERIPVFTIPATFSAFAASPTGGAISAVAFYDGSAYYNLFATRYQVGVGWVAPVALENRTSSVTDISVGFDDSGQARVLWYQSNGGFYFYEATWSPSAGWSAERGALPTSTYGLTPRMVVLPSGLAVLAFNSYNFSASRYCLNVIRNIPGTGWQTPAPCTEYIPGPSTLEVGSDSTGSGLLAVRNSTDGQPYGAEFSPQGVGRQAKILLPSETISGGAFTVASMGHGTALVMVTWYNSTAGYYNSKVNRWTGIDTAAPWVTVDRPLRGASFQNGFAEVTGSAEPGSDVLVNGARAVVMPNGTYTALAPLSEGQNILQAVAIDAAGNRGYSNTKAVWQTEMTRINEPERNVGRNTGWREVIPFDNVSFGSGWWPNIESDAQGNAWVTWYEYSPTLTVYAARYVNGSGWSAPMHMRHADGGDIFSYPSLAVDANGNALVLWNEYNAAYNNITAWARVWLVSGGWQDEMRVDNASAWAYQLSAAASNDGRFMVAWRQDESPAAQVYAMEYRVGAGWGNRTRVSLPGNVSHVPDVTYNSTGYAQLVYCWRPGTWDVIMIANMTPAGVWSSPTPLQNLTPVYIAGQPEIKSGLGSNFTVSWTQINGSYRDSMAGRFVNGSWQGRELVRPLTWDWPQELVVDAEGYAYLAQTEQTQPLANAWAAVSAPGQPFGASFILDNGTLWGGGPRLALSFNRSTASVMWDEQEDGLSRGNMRTYNKAAAAWGPVVRHEPDSVQSNIPDLAPMPDGGYLVAFCRWVPNWGGYQMSGQRYIPMETQAPALTVSTPTNGFLTTSPTTRVQGTTESGAIVTINGVVASVAPNGTFALDIALVNGTNAIYITARDAAGNMNSTWRNGTFDDPDRRRIEAVEAENAALNAALNATNAALAAQNATLLGQIASLNASLLAQLAAQNSSLLNAIGNLNASLLAQLAAQNSTLLNLIAQTNASLLAQMAAQNASLLNLIAQTNASLLAQLAAGDASLAALIASTNASLLASLAAQNASLAAAIAQTNSTLFAALAAQNTALLDALADQNASLLAQMAAEDQALAALIADTNASLLAELAAQNASLLDALAQQDAALLASLAAQNSSLLATIALTNSSLLANLAAQNASLYAQLTAGDGAVWAALNSSAAAQQSALSGTQAGLETTNGSLSDTQDDVARVDQAAANAALMGTLGLILGLAGAGVAIMSIMMSRRGGHPPSGGEALRAPPPTPGGAQPVDAEVVSSGGTSHGHSMAAEAELGGSGENQ